MAITYSYISRSKRETIATLEENGMRIRVWIRKKGIQVMFHPYGSIKSVHLSQPDLNWHTIVIRFDSGYKLHMKSLVFGRREGDRVLNESAAQGDSYRAWVLCLHEKLLKANLAETIKFRQGSVIITLLCLLMAAVCLFAFIPMAWYAKAYALLVFFCIAVPVCLLFAFRIGFKKPYLPAALPEKYLPAPTFK